MQDYWNKRNVVPLDYAFRPEKKAHLRYNPPYVGPPECK